MKFVSGIVIKRMICPKCGNVDKFYVDAQKTMVRVVLTFGKEGVELDDSFPQDVEIFPTSCYECGANVKYQGFILKEKSDKVCQHCVNRFKCFTDKNECLGFQFEQEKVDLL